MRVAFVMPGVGVVSRGAEAFVVELCRALNRRPGFEVTLFCRGEAPVPHHRIRALPRDRRWLNAVYGASRFGKKVFDTLFLDPLSVEWYTAALAALPALWRGRFDVLVMEGGLVGSWLARLLRSLRGTSFVDIAHSLEPRWEGAFARQRPDRVVVFTETAAEMLRELAPRATVTVIPHGVDLERFRPGLEPVAQELPAPVILSAGALDDHKRAHLTVEAVARLEPAASLLLLGSGPAAAAVDALAHQRLGAHRYRRLEVPHQEMPRWYAAADLFALPSRSESFGLVYLEAMACGVACIAPDDAVRRAVIGDAGVLCDVEDTDAYAAALRRGLETAWGERPRRRAEAFPFEHTADRYAALFEELRNPSDEGARP